MNTMIESLEQRNMRTDLPQFKAGDTLRVHFKVIEGNRQRIQVFEGICLKRQGSGFRETFTVRKQSFGVGVERTFPLHSPKIEKLEVMAIGDVRAPSSTTCAREWGRRRASGSSDRASEYCRPRGSIQRPASPRVRPQARSSVRRRRGRGGTGFLPARSSWRACSSTMRRYGEPVCAHSPG